MIVIIIIASLIILIAVAIAIDVLFHIRIMKLAYYSLCEIDWAEEIYKLTHNTSLYETDDDTVGKYRYFEKLILQTIEMKLLHWRKR